MENSSDTPSLTRSQKIMLRLLLIWLAPRYLLRRLRQTVQNFWDELNEVDTAIVFGYSEVFLAFVMVIVHYEAQLAPLSRQVRTAVDWLGSAVPWMLLPLVFLLCGLLLLRPISNPAMRLCFILPVFGYGLLLLVGAFSGQLVIAAAQSAAFTLSGFFIGLVGVRKFFGEHEARLQLAQFYARQDRLEFYVNYLVQSGTIPAAILDQMAQAFSGTVHESRQFYSTRQTIGRTPEGRAE